MSFAKEWTDGLLAVCRRVGQPALAKEVEKACQSGRAFLFRASDGWIVLEPRTEPLPHLFVLAAYCTGGNAIARYEPTIFQLARAVGLSIVRFESVRKGYMRVMPARGWSLLVDGQTWEKSYGWW